MLKFLPIFIKAARWLIMRVEPENQIAKQVRVTAINALNDLDAFYNYFGREVK